MRRRKSDRLWWGALLAVLALAWGPAARGEEAPHRRRALLIGISRYSQRTDLPADQRWPDLHCDQDVAELRQVLTSDRWGFRADDVTVLPETQATRQGIIEAIEQVLIAPSQPGDVAVFYLGCHGQNLPDDGNDEWDGLDQAFVTWDYRGRGAEDNRDAILRDDALGELLSRLAAKVHGATPEQRGNITVILDSCHSGTATRGAFIPRGRYWDQTLDGPLPERARRAEPAARGYELRGEPPAATLVKPGSLGDEYVAFSACGRGQLAKEFDAGGGVYRGAFTYHLVKALAAAGPQTTGRALLARLRADLRGAGVPDQDPQLEGQLDTPLFGRGALPVPGWIPVRRVDANADAVVLPVGSLHGVTVGSVYTLYRAGGQQRAEARLAEATVSEVGLTQCRAKLPAGTTAQHGEALAAAEAVETQHQYSAERLRLHFAPEAAAWAPRLAGLAAVTTEGVTATDCDVHLGLEAGGLVLRARGLPSEHAGQADREEPGRELARYPDAEASLPALSRELEARWRWQRLARLHNDSPYAAIGLELRLVPVEVTTDPQGKITGVGRDLPVDGPDGQLPALAVGSHFVLELRNASATPLYATVLDLSPNGAIVPLFPEKGEAVDHRVPADGQWHRVPSPAQPKIFRLQEPLGLEIFKVIGTTDDVDLSSLAQDAFVGRPRGEHTRGGPFGPLADLVDSVTRGAASVAVSGSGWATGEVTFRITPQP